MVVIQGEEVEEMGECWSKSTKLQLGRKNMPGDLRYTVTIVVNNVLKNGNMLKK